jgi:DNA primase
MAGVLDQTRGVRHSLEASETSLRIQALPTTSGGRGNGLAVPLVNKVIKDATVALTRLIPGSFRVAQLVDGYLATQYPSLFLICDRDQRESLRV